MDHKQFFLPSAAVAALPLHIAAVLTQWKAFMSESIPTHQTSSKKMIKNNNNPVNFLQTIFRFKGNFLFYEMSECDNSGRNHKNTSNEHNKDKKQ